MPRFVHAAVQAYRDTGRPMVQRHLLWITARLIATGEPVTAGFWDGRDPATIAVYDPETGDVTSRAYGAAGGVVSFDPVGQMSGLDIHPAQVTLSPLTPAVDQALRAYDLRGAEVEMHRLWLDYDTRAALAPAHVWFTGRVNRITWPRPAEGGTARLTLTMVPATRDLTLPNPDALGDAAHRLRSPDDGFLRYVGVAGTREIPWMRRRATGATGATLLGGATEIAPKLLDIWRRT